MLAYGAIAQLALAEFPGVVIIPPPPPPHGVRPNPQGTVTIVDVVPDHTYGTIPLIGAPFALIINNPFIYTPTALVGPLNLLFIAPSGKAQFADPDFISVNGQTLLQNEQFNSPQYLLYQTAVREFNEAGVWQVIVQAANAQSQIYFFTVAAS